MNARDAAGGVPDAAVRTNDVLPVPVTRGRDAHKRVAPSGFLSSTRDTRAKDERYPGQLGMPIEPHFLVLD